MVSISWLTFIAALLATWRVTHLLVVEDGPSEIIFKLRKIANNSYFGKLMDCFGCATIWTALLFSLIISNSLGEIFLLWYGLSGGAMLINSLIGNQIIIEHLPER